MLIPARLKGNPKRNSKSRHALIWPLSMHCSALLNPISSIPILCMFVTPQIDALINRGFPEPMLRALLTAFASTNAIAIDLTSLAQSASLYADERAKWSDDRSGSATSLVTAPSTLPLPPHQTLIELLAVTCSLALKMPVRVVRCTPQTRPRDLFYSNLQQQQSQADNASSTSLDSMLRLASNLQPAARQNAEEFLRLVQSHFAARDGLLASLASEELDFINSNQAADGGGNAGDAPSASPPPFLRFKSQVAATVSPTNRVGLAHRRMESDSFTPSSSRFTSVGLHRGDVGNISADQQQQQFGTPLFYRDASQRVAMPMGPPLTLALTRSQRSDASQQQPAQTHTRTMLDSFANHSVGPALMSVLIKQISLAKKPTSPSGSPRACAPVALGGGLPRPPSAALGASSALPSADDRNALSVSSSPQGERRNVEVQFSHENVGPDHHQSLGDEPSPPPPQNEDEHETAAAVSSPSPSDAVQSPSRGKMFHFGSSETAAPESLQTPLSRNASMAGSSALLAGPALPSATVAAHRASMNFISPPPMQQPASSSQRWNRASDATNASMPQPSAVDQLDGPLFANVCIFEDFHLAPAAIQTIILEVCPLLSWFGLASLDELRTMTMLVFLRVHL